METAIYFGDRPVREDEKAPLVRDVFNAVAGRYDLMNDLMSGGLHRLWKDDMVSLLHPRPDMHVLDVAGGTGDIAFRILRRAACNITIADINAKMLGEGRDRAIDRHLAHGIEWLCADAESLPLPDNTFDAYTIAFGIRNITHNQKALAEAFRVLKPGGRFLCLEFSYVENPWLQKFYDAYSLHVIPRIGKLVTGNEGAYRYLVESIRRFPRPEAFAAMIAAAGFAHVSYRRLTQGVVALHSGWKF